MIEADVILFQAHFNDGCIYMFYVREVNEDKGMFVDVDGNTLSLKTQDYSCSTSFEKAKSYLIKHLQNNIDNSTSSIVREGSRKILHDLENRSVEKHVKIVE